MKKNTIEQLHQQSTIINNSIEKEASDWREGGGRLSGKAQKQKHFNTQPIAHHPKANSIYDVKEKSKKKEIILQKNRIEQSSKRERE